MTDTMKRVPSWVWSAVWQAVLLIFALGVASERYAPKEFVTEQIKAHAEATEAQHKEDIKEIKAILERMEARQYEQAKQKR